MKTKYYFFAALATVMLASCADDQFVGDNSPTAQEDASGKITFGFDVPNITRADINGKAAAELLGNHFYVTGTKGTEEATYPTAEIVFDNYLVEYKQNTAGTTASNTANWEYVGIKPGIGDYENWCYLTSISRTADDQTIKYWDYSKAQYDFMAFSTGTYKAGAAGNESTKTIGVTAMQYGAGLNVSPSVPTAYTFDLPSEEALKNAFISDIVEVPLDNYGKDVKLTFKNLGSKVRMALYETIPGYSVKNVKFYEVEGAASPTDLGSGTVDNGTLISSEGSVGIPSKGTIHVIFPHVGNNNGSKQDYNKASATVESGGSPLMKKAFGALTAQLTTRENKEVKYDESEEKWVAEGGEHVFLGRKLTEASFAGDENAKFYQTVFPISTSAPLTLRVDYTLVPTDGAHETIVVKGAKAVVPSTYTKWLPNYAYTYIFKISDNTNGWTGAVGKPAGLFPITFDAVVTEATDVTAEQRTVTTVATPSITTYQQYHMTDKDEYSKKVKDLDGTIVERDVYVQVMDNEISPAKLIGTSPSTKPLLNTNAEEGTAASRLFKVTTTGADISEATVMDALENRTTDLDADNVGGRNGITLTKDANIVNNVTSIVNGADDNPIEKVNGVAIAEGQVAKIEISKLDDNTSYAYVYDYTGVSTEKNKTTIWQPIATVKDETNVDGLQYIAVSELVSWDNGTAAHYTAESENAAKDYLYFSVTTNGGSGKTYSFVSVDNKIDKALPKGLLKVAKSQLHDVSGTGNKAADSTFYFTTYVHNDGKYAVKVIKVVAAPV